MRVNAIFYDWKIRRSQTADGNQRMRMERGDFMRGKGVIVNLEINSDQEDEILEASKKGFVPVFFIEVENDREAE